eukprot:TRINITY_DN9876_c0_g2_i1.p1 TRINITY_DN9876_c0_g2~~TRINITY_DN9876_c0_g2_i1.p1  ORF type:complete len:220 (-),score=-16.80 TRINITY_DN9876_c0_g2_i1:116-775(-)
MYIFLDNICRVVYFLLFELVFMRGLTCKQVYSIQQYIVLYLAVSITYSSMYYVILFERFVNDQNFLTLSCSVIFRCLSYKRSVVCLCSLQLIFEKVSNLKKKKLFSILRLLLSLSNNLYAKLQQFSYDFFGVFQHGYQLSVLGYFQLGLVGPQRQNYQIFLDRKNEIICLVIIYVMLLSIVKCIQQIDIFNYIIIFSHNFILQVSFKMNPSSISIVNLD